MNRRTALITLSALTAATLTALINRRFTVNKKKSETENGKMPIIFIGHGSPMNAIENNSYTQSLNHVGKILPKPKAILMISAHWMTKGTWVTHMKNPKTIHDFYGFPQELFDVNYPAPGNPELAEKINLQITDPNISLDENDWGLDHGTWAVLKHVYPKADVPIVQLSLDMTKPAEFHFELGRKLNSLRDQGILIMGSGNIVHNLRRISWEENAKPFDWAVEFDEWSKKNLSDRNFNEMIRNHLKSEAGRLSVPTPDHYYPLLYILGASDEKDQVHFDYEGMQNGSISMRSVRFG